jgi:hypothetical protein
MFIGSIHKKNVEKDYIEVPLLRLIKNLRCRDFEKYNCFITLQKVLII